MTQLHEPERRQRARLPRGVHVVVGAGVERTRRHLLRVVHQDVDATEAVDGLGDDRLAVGPLAHTARERERVTAERGDLGDGARTGLGIAFEDRDAGAGSGQRERDAASDTTPAAGDDGDLPVERLIPEGHAAGYGATGTASLPVSQWRPAARRSSHLANAASSVWPSSSGVGPISSAIGRSASTSKP